MTNRSTNELVMSFDFGQKKIGVAVGQRITMTARTLTTIKARDGIPNWDYVGELVREWQPSLFVVGLPLNMDGTNSALSQRCEKFARRLNGRFNIPYQMMDERLTSFEARGIEGNPDKTVDDIAAQLILESFFRQEQ